MTFVQVFEFLGSCALKPPITLATGKLGPLGTVSGLDEMAMAYSGEESNQGARRTERGSWKPSMFSIPSRSFSNKPKDKLKDKARDGAKPLPGTLNEGPENFMDITELAPSTAQQQCERGGIPWEAQNPKQETPQHQHNDVVYALVRQDTIDTLESEKMSLKTEIVKLNDKIVGLNNQLADTVAEGEKRLSVYQELENYIRLMREKLGPKYRQAVDENGQQPPTWTLAFCFQQFVAIEKERMDREAYFQNEMQRIEAQHQQEKKNLCTKVANVINLCEEMKRGMGTNDIGERPQPQKADT